jgi:hypothetical protein
MSKKTREAVKQYVVGDKAAGADFSQAEIAELKAGIVAYWLSPDSGRNMDGRDPEAEASEVIRQCLLAATKDGSPWRGCPAEFAKRVASKTGGYDMEGGNHRRQARVKAPTAVRALSKAAEDGARDVEDAAAPAPTFDQDSYRAEYKANMHTKFPELQNPVYEGMVDQLALLQTQRKLADFELSTTSSQKKRDKILSETLPVLTKLIEATMKSLDIYPDQLHKQIKQTKEGTLGALVARISEDQEFRERETTWARQEALQLWWMSQHMNGREDGPQVHAWEIWHATRTLPIRFKSPCCGKEYTIVRGFTPDDLLEYLLAVGALKRLDEPVNPAFDPAALAGLQEYAEQWAEARTVEGDDAHAD